VCAFSQENGGKSKSVGKTREKKNSPMDSRFVMSVFSQALWPRIYAVWDVQNGG